MRVLVIVLTTLVAASQAYALTCNGEARATCESKGGTWNSSNCTCSGG